MCAFSYLVFTVQRDSLSVGPFEVVTQCQLSKWPLGEVGIWPADKASDSPSVLSIKSNNQLQGATLLFANNKCLASSCKTILGTHLGAQKIFLKWVVCVFSLGIH